MVNGTFKGLGPLEGSAGDPTLLLVGRYDTMSVADVQKMGKEIPNSRVAVCETGSHLSMWDDQQAYFRHLLGFWSDVDAGKFHGAHTRP